MEVDIRQQGRCTSTLPRTHLHLRSLALFQHARVQPFLDERTTRRSAIRCWRNWTSHACDSMSKKLRTSRSSIQFTRLSSSPHHNASSALCWLRPGPEPVREAEEVGFVDLIEYFHVAR
jgi:hypothetical protein